MTQDADVADEGPDRLGGRPAGGGLWWCAALIVVAGVAAYHNSLRAPFVFDDDPSIVENPTIRRLWPPGPMLNPPAKGQAVQRRPVVNVSLAVNYAISGLSVWSYHATNVGLHLLAALTLLGIVRRTLESPRLRERFGAQALGLATTVAGLWAVHPLLTDAVTYIIQRTEVLAGLFYLLTLYAVIRGDSSSTPGRWYVGAVAACLLAMGSKEAAVSAPVVVLVYDRIFLARSWREIRQKREWLYRGMAATWVVVILLVPRGAEGSQIFGAAHARFQYALAQGEAIVRYLGLCFWPGPLAVDYGFCPPQTVGGALPYLAVVAALLGATVWAFWCRAELAFLGLSFFAILAPSSSIIPLPQQVAAEKRMYLPLAAVVTLTVVGGWALWTALTRRWARRWLVAVPIALAALAGVALAARTVVRNDDYRTAEALWVSAVNTKPANPHARNNLGNALQQLEHYDQAAEQYQEALRLWPNYPEAESNWGNTLARRKRFDEAIPHYEKALGMKPDFAEAHRYWGNVLFLQGRYADAAGHHREALRLKPDYPAAAEDLRRAEKKLRATRKAGTP
ncbi:MAG: tetratricopeptide repeat protein [Planctomycetota bacterium]|nr:tetratricopeptide repeat protein [Planctomycetota bacterium]